MRRVPGVGTEYCRSRHILLLWEGDDSIVLDCETLSRYRVGARTVRLLAVLGSWRTKEELNEFGIEGADTTLGVLVERHLVHQRDSADPLRERETVAKAWDPISLAYQRLAGGGNRSATGTHHDSDLSDSRYRKDCGSIVLLPRDASIPYSFGDVLERRRTKRNYDALALSLADLGTLLYYSARAVNGVRIRRSDGEPALRPYAAGGGCGELEVYVIANSVEGIESGAYWYDVVSHELVLVDHTRKVGFDIVQQVQRAANLEPETEPAAVIVITAVFERVISRYGYLGLKLIYLDVGCLLQTLYLVSTSLHLAPCAIGGGDEVKNSVDLGLDPLVECQVAAFMLGPATDSAERGYEM